MNTQKAIFNFRTLNEAAAKKVGFPISDEEAIKPFIVPPAKEGEEIKYKRPALTLELPALGVSDLESIIAKGLESKEFKLVMDTLNDVFFEAAKEQVDADPLLTQEGLDLNKLSWSYIANLPPAERGRRGISAETWKEWASDYVSVMSTVLSIDPEKIANQSAVFVKKFEGPIKTNKPLLAKLRELLGTWLEHSEAAESFVDVYKFLDAKAEALINAEEKDFTENLGL